MGKLMHGADAEDRVIKVPAGTIVREPETEKVIVEFENGRTVCDYRTWWDWRQRQCAVQE